MVNHILLNSVFFKNLSPLVTTDVVQNFLAPHLADSGEILRIDFRYFPGSVQRFCQVDFRSSAGVTAAISLNGLSLLGVPVVATVIDPLSQATSTVPSAPTFSSITTNLSTAAGAPRNVSTTTFNLINNIGVSQNSYLYREPETQQLNRTIHVANIPEGWDVDRLVVLLSAHVKQLERMSLVVTDKKLIEGVIPETNAKDRIALIEFKTSEMAEVTRKLPQFARFIDGKEMVISQAKATVTPREPDNVSFELPPSVPVPVAYQQLNKLKLQEKISRARALAQNILSSSNSKQSSEAYEAAVTATPPLPTNTGSHVPATAGAHGTLPRSAPSLSRIELTRNKRSRPTATQNRSYATQQHLSGGISNEWRLEESRHRHRQPSLDRDDSHRDRGYSHRRRSPCPESRQPLTLFKDLHRHRDEISYKRPKISKESLYRSPHVLDDSVAPKKRKEKSCASRCTKPNSLDNQIDAAHHRRRLKTTLSDKSSRSICRHNDRISAPSYNSECNSETFVSTLRKNDAENFSYIPSPKRRHQRVSRSRSKSRKIFCEVHTKFPDSRLYKSTVSLGSKQQKSLSISCDRSLSENSKKGHDVNDERSKTLFSRSSSHGRRSHAVANKSVLTYNSNKTPQLHQGAEAISIRDSASPLLRSKKNSFRHVSSLCDSATAVELKEKECCGSLSQSETAQSYLMFPANTESAHVMTSDNKCSTSTNNSQKCSKSTTTENYQCLFYSNTYEAKKFFNGTDIESKPKMLPDCHIISPDHMESNKNARRNYCEQPSLLENQKITFSTVSVTEVENREVSNRMKQLKEELRRTLRRPTTTMLTKST